MESFKLGKHWSRLRRSLGRRWKEWRLPRGYKRLGTRYGGWWINTLRVRPSPLLIDCGLGKDISFPTAFLQRFAQGRVIGIDPNPYALAYCRANCPPGMEILDRAFWTTSGKNIVFHLPRPPGQLPKGADGVSGSLDPTHEYVEGGERIETTTVNLATLLDHAGRDSCDVLKLDIEGAEYELLAALIADGQILRTEQVLVEFHHGVTNRGQIDTLATVAALKAAGFSLIHTEGRNYSFSRGKT